MSTTKKVTTQKVIKLLEEGKMHVRKHSHYGATYGYDVKGFTADHPWIEVRYSFSSASEPSPTEVYVKALTKAAEWLIEEELPVYSIALTPSNDKLPNGQTMVLYIPKETEGHQYVNRYEWNSSNFKQYFLRRMEAEYDAFNKREAVRKAREEEANRKLNEKLERARFLNPTIKADLVYDPDGLMIFHVTLLSGQMAVVTAAWYTEEAPDWDTLHEMSTEDRIAISKEEKKPPTYTKLFIDLTYHYREPRYKNQWRAGSKQFSTDKGENLVDVLLRFVADTY